MSWDQDALKKKGLVTTGFHLPYNSKLLSRARVLRRNMTNEEKKLWMGFFKKWPYRILRQRPIDNFIVDFYCPKLKLVIEIDDDSHFTEKGICYDRERTRILEGYGLRVVRFPNDEVLNHFKDVCRRIKEVSLFNT